MQEQEDIVDMIIQGLDSRVGSESPAHRVYGKRLNSIKKILQEASSNEIDEETDLKEVVFDTDSVLTTIEAREKSRSTVLSSSPLSPRPLLSYSPPLEWLFRQKIKRRLSKIQRDLEKIAPSHGSVKQADAENDNDGSVKRLGGRSGRRVFFSESIKRRICEEEKFLTDSTNKEFEKVMDWLLSEGKSDEIDVFGLVGESGVGKTSLARKIFEDKVVKDHFKFRFWVDIPKNCDEQGAVKSILRELARYRTGNIILEYGQKPENNLESLVKVIKGSCLLVLDNSDHFDTGCKWWNHLKSYLKVREGSKVVAISNNVNADIERKITLKPLEELESLNLFLEAAMKKVNSDLMKTTWIEESVEMILSKCCGLPIAINAMGAMLADKNQKQWEEVLEKLKDFEGNAAVKACLLLCCEDLKDECKKCFQSLSIFGEQVMEIDKMSLIYWWIGEGIVRSEDKGKKVFDMLVGQSLVEGIMTGKGKIYSCRVHLIVRNLLEEMNNDEQSKTKIPRRLRFCTELKVMKLDEKEQKKPIESILQVGNDDPNYLVLPVERFPELKQLKVLHLGWWQKSSWFHVEISSQNFISSLCHLENLRYLSLRGISGITKLPRSIKKLRHLRILDLRACYDLEKLPKEITSLKELTHLDTSRCYFLEFMPKGLGKLSKLVSLRGFKLGNSRNKHCCRLRELQNLKNLSKLSIRIWREDEVQDDELKLFSNFSCLTALRLEFGYRKSADEASNSNFVKKLNQLCPPPRLSKLELLCYPGKETPDWLNPSELPYLRRLYFSGGPLGTLNNSVSGQKWKLNTLYLRFLANLQGREEELWRAMPDLVLKVHKCPKFAPAMVEQTIHEEEDDSN